MIIFKKILPSIRAMHNYPLCPVCGKASFIHHDNKHYTNYRCSASKITVKSIFHDAKHVRVQVEGWKCNCRKIAFRPELVKLSKQPLDEGINSICFSGVITDILLQGNMVRYHIMVRDAKIKLSDISLKKQHGHHAHVLANYYVVLIFFWNS